VRKTCQANALVEFVFGVSFLSLGLFASFQMIHAVLTKNRVHSLARFGLDVHSRSELSEETATALINEYRQSFSDGDSWRWQGGRFRDISSAAFYPFIEMEVWYPLKGWIFPSGAQGREHLVGLKKGDRAYD
jgi:hypothetical protein